MRRVWAFLIAFAAFTCHPSQGDAGLIINLINNGGTAPTTTGTGTLSTVMRAAADVWELAFNKWAFTHTLTLEFRWTDLDYLGSGVLAAHSLLSQGGTPHRENYGQIDFDNDNTGHSFFLDGTLDTDSLADLITSSSEYTGITESSDEYGGGSINHQREFSAVSSEALSRHDLFTVALHEIGHALGMSSGNSAYSSETTSDSDIDVGGTLPFTGTVIPVVSSSNAHLTIGTTLLFSSLGAGVRKLPSAVDILANAQLSQFIDPNLDLDVQPVPEPSSLLLASILGGCGLVFRVRRRRDSADSKASAA